MEVPAGKAAALDSRWVRLVLDRHEAALVRYAHRMLGDRDRAMDVVQEAFLRLCGQSPEQREKLQAHVGQWLYTVVRHLALNVIRKDQRLHPLSETQSQSRLSGEATPDAAAESHEFASLAFAALNELPDNQRECVVLKFEHGMSYRQISEVTGLTTSYVGYLIHTGLKALRLRLGAAAAARPGLAGGSG